MYGVFLFSCYPSRTARVWFVLVLTGDAIGLPKHCSRRSSGGESRWREGPHRDCGMYRKSGALAFNPELGTRLADWELTKYVGHTWKLGRHA